MKKMIFILAFMMTTTICVKGHDYDNMDVTISVRTFYDELLPYGDWINTPDYGYIWRPYLNDQENFRPYATRGNWVYTDLGWMWVSDYRWGWAAFHYGRWFFDDYLGWMWVPGSEWAPAWVTWGTYNDLWAWAPMGPNIYVNVHSSWRAPHSWWTFVPRRHFCTGNWHTYIYNQPVQVTNITNITNVYYDNNNHRNGGWFNGPRIRDVERHLNKRVRKMQLVDSNKPENRVARDNRVNVYRPSVTIDRDNVRPAKYRTVENARSDLKIQRATDPTMKHTRDSGMEKRSTDQNTRVTRQPGNNPQPVREHGSSVRSAGSPQSSGIDRSVDRTNSGKEIRRKKSEDKTAVRSSPANSSSPRKR
ncbi:MAG: hypothetical protein Q8M08_03345 [Bacteroidales bacterium]|nr:hypothetical protein [Bacteroidales bacterium]